MNIDGIIQMKRRFESLFRNYPGLDPNFIETEFMNLVGFYSALGRHYHTLEHIKHCLDLADEMHFATKKMHLVRLAIWYHDAIYDTKSKENEKKSANLFMRLAELLNMKSEDIDEVVAMIMASDHKGTKEEYPLETKLFLDIDIAILGAERNVYAKYDEDIRKEYSWVPEEEYLKGRTQVLASFLNRKPLYLTEQFQSRFEDTAKANLALSLQALFEGKMFCTA